MQGGIWPSTIQTADLYSSHSWVDSVIVSTWDDESITTEDHALIENNPNIILLVNKKPDIVGAGNLDLQILSSRYGIEKSTSEFVMKIRTDQRIFPVAFRQWKFYVDHHIQEEPMDLGLGRPKGKIFVIGMNHLYPYHLQDHIFWGYREDMKLFFDSPLSLTDSGPGGSHLPSENGQVEFTLNGGLRGPIYLGAHYFARFSEKAKEHSENPEKYLYDDSPNRKEAMEHYTDTRDSIFKILPRIDDCMWWEKFNTGYWYDRYYSMGERYV